MLKIAVLVSGGGTNLQALIDAQEKGHIQGKIDLVISNKKDAFALQRAKKASIDTLYISPKEYPTIGDFDAVILEQLEKRNIDLVVLAGYLKILSPAFTQAFEHRIINIHPSLIPAFCGKGYHGIHVHQAAIKKGVKYSGATTHFVDEKVDHGYIIEQGICRVEPQDTAESLAKKVLKIEHEILIRSVTAFCEGKIKINQHGAYVEE